MNSLGKIIEKKKYLSECEVGELGTGAGGLVQDKRLALKNERKNDFRKGNCKERWKKSMRRTVFPQKHLGHDKGKRKEKEGGSSGWEPVWYAAREKV